MFESNHACSNFLYYLYKIRSEENNMWIQLNSLTILSDTNEVSIRFHFGKAKCDCYEIQVHIKSFSLHHVIE